jgi:transcriptional regulator with PAS, ATPase and Fis domain
MSDFSYDDGLKHALDVCKVYKVVKVEDHKQTLIGTFFEKRDAMEAARNNKNNYNENAKVVQKYAVLDSPHSGYIVTDDADKHLEISESYNSDLEKAKQKLTPKEIEAIKTALEADRATLPSLRRYKSSKF